MSPPSPERIFQLAWGYAPPLILETAVRVGLFDALEAGPSTVHELHKRLGVTRRGLRAVCNALVGLEFLTREGEHYALAPESAAYLVRGRPGFRGDFLLNTSHRVLAHWTRLTEAVRTGLPVEAVNREESGAEYFKSFVESLFPLGYDAACALAEHLLPSEPRDVYRVLDLAAGSGVWSIAFAQRSERVRVTAVDWPDVAEVTQAVARRHGVAERYTLVGGDLAEVDFGTGHDLAVLGHILHSEGEDRSRALLRKVHGALAPGGTVAIAEFLPDEDRKGPLLPLLFAVNMLLHTDEGDTFTLGEIQRWLTEAGFADVRTFAAPAPSPLVLATRVPTRERSARVYRQGDTGVGG